MNYLIIPTDSGKKILCEVSGVCHSAVAWVARGCIPMKVSWRQWTAK